VSSSLRVDLAAALAEAGPPGLSVFTEEPKTPPAARAIVIRPGQPYRQTITTPTPYCRERWRLELVALVPIDAVLPLDELDGLIDLCRDVARPWPAGTYNGVRLAPTDLTISGKTYHGAVVELDVDVDIP
jgi:hypothetical protein